MGLFQITIECSDQAWVRPHFAACQRCRDEHIPHNVAIPNPTKGDDMNGQSIAFTRVTFGLRTGFGALAIPIRAKYCVQLLQIKKEGREQTAAVIAQFFEVKAEILR